MAEEKIITTSTFEGGANSDEADHILKQNMFRYMNAMRIYGKSTAFIPTKVLGNTLIPNNLPAGNNKGHGWGKNEESGKLYLFNYNDQGNHGIYAYDVLTGAITSVLLSKTDSNGVDIMKFDPAFPIYHVDVVTDKLLYWVDGLNKARKTNILKCIDKSSTGYGTVVTEDLITAYKQTAVYAPGVAYFTDLNRTSNYLYALQFKFAVRFYYDDGEQSNVSDYSAVALPPNESYLGADSITFDNNCIKVSFETGSTEVSKIELLVKIDQADFVSCIVLNKDELGIGDFGFYTYNFYNDGAYNAVDAVKVARPYSFLPPNPYTQAFVKTAMIYGNFDEGFGVVNIDAEVDVTYTPFYLPSGTVSQLNNPIFTENLTSTHLDSGRWISVTHFVIGFDVKKGNVFKVNVTGAHPTTLSYTATLTDDATTVASVIKTFLLSRDAVGTPVISGESTDGDGNVSWDFTIRGHYGDTVIAFNTFVTAVNYSTLLDNGLSIQTIKQGSTRKYGIVYQDDDGRTSLTYTADALLTVTQFETETVLGSTTPIGLQQPIHTIKIKNKPPIWAKYWSLVRTNDTETFIQLLIQQVNTVVVANEPTYLDMIVGSLFTYQKIHPDTILQYQFERGDRLRLISKYDPDTEVPTLYTPYYETEVLSYIVDEEIPVYANIRTSIGVESTHVTPADGPKADYVGKNIIIEGVERTIVAVDSTDYILDQFLELKSNATPDLYTVPSYTIVDRRGIIRIKNPPASYNVSDLSLVEVYRPQQNLDNASYLNFFDFQNKYAISNWGTENAAHMGNVQNQDPANPSTVPAIIKVTQGNAYVRNRAMPTNNQDPNPQVLIDQICDPNFSDFYESNLYDLGRVYPQDQAFGVVKFGSRVRYSNNYIEDTRINGLNDFDNTDRKDYNDPYGTITLLRFKQNYLKVYKQLRNAWTLVGQRVIHDNSGSQLVSTSDNLLNDLEYAEWEGGIGNNPESYTENGNSEYIASANSGVILRVAQNGSEPISTVFNFDYKVRNLLSFVSRYNLKIPAGFDKANDDALWSVDQYINYLFNNSFQAGDWQTILNPYPDGTTWTITQQPAHSTATVVDDQIHITGTSTVGGDFFKFQGNLPGGGTTPVINFCFTVVVDPNRPIIYTADPSSKYCIFSYGNDFRSQNFTKNDCGGGFTGSVVAYSIPAGTYIAASQAAADALAQADIDANGQAYANAHGTCTPIVVYHSVAKSGVFQKDCSGTPGTSGTYVEYDVPAGAYTSTISQADADAQAQNDVDTNGQGYANTHGTCIITSLKGTFLVDYYNDSDGDICFYCNTVGVAESGIPVTARANNSGAGVNEYPNDGRDPATCYLLSSDRLLLSGSVSMRFGVNMAYFIATYPAIDHFTFVMRGRTSTANAGVCSGVYALRNISEGYLAMQAATGEPSKLIPTVVGASPTVTGYSSHVVSGGDGTTGVAIGSPILQMDYVVSTDTLSTTTF
jgi:hypothetical protein